MSKELVATLTDHITDVRDGAFRERNAREGNR